MQILRMIVIIALHYA